MHHSTACQADRLRVALSHIAACVPAVSAPAAPCHRAVWLRVRRLHLQLVRYLRHSMALSLSLSLSLYIYIVRLIHRLVVAQSFSIDLQEISRDIYRDTVRPPDTDQSQMTTAPSSSLTTTESPEHATHLRPTTQPPYYSRRTR